MQTLIIKGQLMDLNKYINESRTHWSNSNSAKQAETTYVKICAKNQRLKPIMVPCIFHYKWYVINKRKDKSNIAFAKKFVEDGLQEAGILKNDGWNNILSFTDEFFIDNRNPRVEVIIEEGEVL